MPNNDTRETEFSILSAEETRAAIADAGKPDEVKQVGVDAVERADADLIEAGDVKQPAQVLVKRRMVTKTLIGHVAQDIIMNAVLALVENFPNDPSVMERVKELGLTADEFRSAIAKQATRVAKTFRFEVA